MEMEEHVRLLTERYRRQGMTAEAAMLAGGDSLETPLCYRRI
jgi:hypothetical protein